MAVFNTRESEITAPDDDIEGTEDYNLFRLNNMDKEDTFQGKPHLFDIREDEYDDEKNEGQKIKKYSATLLIINDEFEEKLVGRLNLKSMDDEVKFFKKSLGYDLIDSIEELHEPGIAGKFDIHKISFRELQEYINNLTTVAITVKGYKAENNGRKFEYNTLRFTRAEA